MIRAFFFLLFFFLLLKGRIMAQQDNHQGHIEPRDHDMEKAASFISPNLPMTVNGSGTAWHPVNSPMYMNLFQPGEWNVMMHYGIFPGFTLQNPEHPKLRGNNELMIPTWYMAMANRRFGSRSLISFRGMFSLDPLIMGGDGYPLLYQTGETFRGNPLIDRQHPHDLFSELAVAYTYSFSDHLDAYAYLGYPGEPALGPPAFMHRPSDLNIPDSPLGHHWQDATHITYGVSTAGLRIKGLRAEASWFTGREPGEERLWFDRPRFDSWSGRMNYLLGNSLVLQASFGYLHSPEAHEPEKDMQRISASILHNWWINEKIVLSSSIVWGLNRAWVVSQPDKFFPAHSFLVGGALQMNRFNFFLRNEFVEKSFHELGIELEQEEEDHLHLEENAWILALKPGGSIYFYKSNAFWLDAGLTFTIHRTSRELLPFYGALSTKSYQIFIRMVPPRMAKH